MTVALTLLVLAAVVVAVAAAGRRAGLSAPLLLLLFGIVVSFLPGVPSVAIDQEIVLIGLLPPLLYAAAIRTSLVGLGANRANIGFLSVGLVIFTAVGVGLVVWGLLGVPFPVALALGGVVAPPDAVAATAVARRIGLPRRAATVLEGESLFNDATALVIVRMAILAMGGAVSAGAVALQFVWAAGAGVVIGVAAAWALGRIRVRVQDTVTDTSLSLMAPWIAYLPAEAVHASGVLAVVVCGVLLGHRAPVIQTAASRMSERINWRTIQFLLENAVFLLIGLQARGIVANVLGSPVGIGRIALLSLAVLATTVLLRPVWVFPFRFLLSRDDPSSRHDKLTSAAVVSWAGMRGVVTLAAAFLIPSDAPHRDVLVLLALVVTAGTLLLQGFSLSWVARRLGVRGPDPRQDALQSAAVLQQAVRAGNAELDRVADAQTPAGVVDLLRSQGERRTHAVWERLGVSEAESPSDAYRRLRTRMLRTEREEVLRLRGTGTIDHEVLDEVMRVLDLEESMLTAIDVRQERWEDALIRTPQQQRGECDHLVSSPVTVGPQTPAGCPDCVREGTTTVHLRLCLTCGNVGCCDSSEARHADRHFRTTRHPVIRSFEPGEEWRWCYVDELLG